MQSEAVNQWLDADHVRSLAEGLLEPSPEAPSFPNDKMFGSSFIGYTDFGQQVALLPERARQSLSDAQNRASSAGILREKQQVAPVSKPTENPPISTPVAGRASVTEGPQVLATTPVTEPTAKVEPATKVEPAAKVEPATKVEPAAEIKPAPGIAPAPPSPFRPLGQVVPDPAEVEASSGADVDASQDEVVVVPEPVKPVASESVRPRPPIESPFKIASEVDDPAPPVREVFRPLPLPERLHAFGGWLMEQIPTRSYFICDRHGEIVVDEVGSEKLVKVARTLAHASSSAGRQVGENANLGSLHVKIGPDRVMEVIPRRSHFGLVVLGVIVQRPLSQDAVASVSRALGTALAEPAEPSAPDQRQLEQVDRWD